MAPPKQNKPVQVLRKSPTGIPGLDEITGGGLPAGRPTLVAGAAGCGKTLFATEFLVNGATRFDEPGVFVAFEENAEELVQNVASLGFDLRKLDRQKKLIIDHVRVERSEIEETGDYDLEGLFIRLGHAIDSIGARRVVLDTIEVLFSAFPNRAILRTELQRLFRWLKDRGVTAIITAERGSDTMTRFGLEEYVADCVVLLDHRVTEHVSTRRLRIVKYRGTLHGTNEYPFLIGKEGISVLPITSIGLDYPVSTQRMSTGLKELDEMLGGRGFYRGSSILLSGTAGTGKTSLAAALADEACRRGERCMYFAFEESADQIIRNMRSIGIDLAPHIKKGLLQFHAARPSQYGLEMHLVTMYKVIQEFEPAIVVLDPITDFSAVGNLGEIKSALTRIIDFLKSLQITALFVSVNSSEGPTDDSMVGVSSLIDAWIGMRSVESDGERRRVLFILKARGLAHSNEIRSFRLTNEGIQIGPMDHAARP